MRAAIRLLTMLCLLWCGLHVAEPAAAHDVSGDTIVALAGAAPADPCDAGSERSAHAGHHHCPIAPDQRLAATTGAPDFTAGAPVTSPTAALASLTRAPPLQPPAA